MHIETFLADNWYFKLAALILIISFAFWLKRRSKRVTTVSLDPRTMEVHKPEELWETDQITFDNWSIKPVCPHCHQSIASVLAMFNTGDSAKGFYVARTASLILCPTCRTIISAGFEASEEDD